MTHHLKPIIITPEQIIAAAQLIANKDENAWESTPEVYLAAVQRYLNYRFHSILGDADWHADKDGFLPSKKYGLSFLDEATELVLPNPPEWAHDEITRITAPLASRPELQPDEHGEFLWVS